MKRKIENVTMKPPGKIGEAIPAVLSGGDILLIIPPFTTTRNPALGVHILERIACGKGYKVEILYLSMALASLLGIELYEYTSFPPFGFSWRMLPDRLFARSAYGLPALGVSPGYCLDEAMSVSGGKPHYKMFLTSEDFDPGAHFDPGFWLRVEEICTGFVDEVAPVIARMGYRIVGCTQREGQTNSSIALLNRVKSLDQGVITITGGTNCKGELAKGVASLSAEVDYIFSGESEHTFSEFLDDLSQGKLPPGRIIPGRPWMDLNELPLPDYTSFFEQTRNFLGREALKQAAVSYETSRDCWWGQRKRCKFCSESTLARHKTVEKVSSDLETLVHQYQPAGVYMCDVAMPKTYHGEIFPRLLPTGETPAVYYQSRANMTLKDLIELKKSKVSQFTFGIEAFSDGLLRLMDKGVTAAQNLLLLRDARSAGCYIDWLLLWGFPGDKAAYYQETLKLLPWIRHLQPPVTLMHLCLVRFSPYFERAQEIGIEHIQPWAVYQMIYPGWADIENLAYWFVGDYGCESHDNPRLLEQIGEEILLWKQLWQKVYVVMVEFNNGYLILDTRDRVGNKQHVVDEARGVEIMKPGVYHGTENQAWAVSENLAVVVTGKYIPLVTAAPELLLRLEEK